MGGGDEFLDYEVGDAEGFGAGGVGVVFEDAEVEDALVDFPPKEFDEADGG